MTRNQKILYVEDDMVTQTAYKRHMEQGGFTVDTAADGLEAMKYLYDSVVHDFKPDLLVLDLVLPRLNGEDLLRLIQKDSQINQIPIILLSTNTFVTPANEHLVKAAWRQLLKHECTAERLLQTIEDLLSETGQFQATQRVQKTSTFCHSTTCPNILPYTQLNRNELAGAGRMERHPEF